MVPQCLKRHCGFLYSKLAVQLYELRNRLGGHDAQLKHIYDAIENLPD